MSRVFLGSILFCCNFLFANLLFATDTPENTLVYGKSYQHQSKIFASKRRYFISLPENYQQNNSDYPVLYLIDGDFQFHHVSNISKHLARFGKIAPMIIVGIANQGPSDYLLSNTWPSKGEDGKNDPAFGGVEKFKAYLYKELVPQIDRQFRTNSKRALAGYSLGGLFVLQSYLDEKSPFNAFLAMSPSAWYDEMAINQRFKIMLNSENTSNQLRAPLFISLANERGMGVNELVEEIKNSKHQPVQWKFKQYPEETHYTTALPALYDALEFLYKDYFIDMPELMKFKDYNEVLDAFAEKKKQWAGFDFGWLQSYTFAKYVFYSKQEGEIEALLKRVKQDFPDSLQEITINLALGLNRKAMFDKAEQLLNTTKAQSAENPKWHYQMSLAQEGLKNPETAKKHHKQALKLAKKYQLESWEYWELEPDKKF
ncbi:alpha/beta hydrolase-fold protein [Aliikangiella sp. G2MR2-5]|uniref:alpha/beta hydrolase-fold protein n=1 Tax=Aliikangiella sp. G2MR2-5 TaxID=2788943 RepID=UPI0018ABEC66|nr:alpha/beta hydrolase-fold protein [Aliikangiella sp. G2MR2-5]